MDPDRPADDAAGPEGIIRRTLARDGRAILAGVIATAAVELGLYFLARAAGVSQSGATLAALAAATLWVAMAAPVFAAGAKTALGALLRGGLLADTSGLCLLILWAASPLVSFLAAVKVYCVLTAMALASIAAIRVARSSAGRHALAVAAAFALLVSLATPFWVGGALRAAGHDSARDIAAAAVYANPFYAVTAAVAQEARFVWHQAGAMYGITRIGDYAAPPAARWYASVLIDLAAAAILTCAATLRAFRGIDRRGTEGAER